MEALPELSFCEILCAYVCLHEKCRSVVKLDNLGYHLQRKHQVSRAICKRETEKLLRSAEGKTPAAIASRYYENPLPKDGECPLPTLPLLPLYDLVKCPCCALFFNGHKACKSHIRCTHSTHHEFRRVLEGVSEIPLQKGQALFLGHARLFFPVSFEARRDDGTKSSQPLILSTGASQHPITTQSDELSLWDKSANLTCTLLGIPEFLEAQRVTLTSAYELSKVDRTVHSKIVSLFLEYVRHFAEMQPPIPMAILEGIKIRNGDRCASFSLSIEPRSKRRYAAVAARFLPLIVRIGSSHPLPFFQVDSEAKKVCDNLLQSVVESGSAPLELVHWFFHVFLLRKSRASVGEVVLIEGLFKILIAGYTCGVQMRRVRVGDSDDASHTAAAMQYFCHLAALGEFFVSPIGFGAITKEEEDVRFKRVQSLLGTETCSPAAYLRTVLLKTKRLSAGESPRIDFVPCTTHPFCGTVDNIEVQLNSPQVGSLGYVVRNLREDVFQMLRVDLMQNFAVPADFMNTLLSFPDKLNEKEPGYYFGSGLEARQKIQSWSEAFAQHVANGSVPLIQQIEPERGGGHRPTVYASTWLRTVDSVTILLYILVHLCGGGPPRVTEMLEAKLRNTAGSRRNVFIVKKRLAIIGSYSKNTKQIQRPKPIARFLDRHTSELLLLFLVFIKPLQCFFLQKSSLDVRATEDYLFCQSGEMVDDTVVCRAFAKALNTRGLPLNISLYRQWRTGIAKAFLTEGKIVTNERLLFLQAGRTEAPARNRYAGGDFNVGELTLAMIEGFYEISTQWHSLLGIQEMKLRDRHQRNPSVAQTEKETNKNDNPHVSLPTRQTSKRRIQEHRKLPLVKRSKRSDTEGSNQAGSRSVLSLHDSILACARNVLMVSEHEDIRFKSEAQRAALFECALQTVVGGYCNSMIVILPTGGGKTLCWAAAVLREQGLFDSGGKKALITVLIVPLISLQQDMMRKCREYGLRCGIWDDRFNEGLSIVICSIDVTFSNEYERYLVSLSAQGRIARVVLDEAHLVLLWMEFRRFEGLGKRLRPDHARLVPLVCLSATLPNIMSVRLQEVLQMDESCVKLYRAQNSRPNISYQVQSVSAESSEEMITYCNDLLKTELEGLNNSERIIVFCLTIKDCGGMHKSFVSQNPEKNCCLYHGSMSQAEKVQSFDTWINSKSELPIVMIATSAFSCGIDYPHVRTVIHVGGCRTIVELVQESGRAGRDGAASKNLIVYNSKYMEDRMGACDTTHDGNTGPFIYGNVKRILGSNIRCRRAEIESFLNSTIRDPCFGEELKCDICESIEAFLDFPMQCGSDSSLVQACDINMCVAPNRKRISAIPSSLSQVNRSRFEEEPLNRFRTLSSNVMVGPLRVNIKEGDRNAVGLEEARWHARQLSLCKCVMCLFKGENAVRGSGHTACMRARCFRYIEKNASHQSKDCNVTPRGSKNVKRCFFCGIPQCKGVHSTGTFNEKDKCEWEVSKNLALLMWRDEKQRHELAKRVPKLRDCRSLAEVGYALCGGNKKEETVLLLQAVEYMYSLFVLGSS